MKRKRYLDEQIAFALRPDGYTLDIKQDPEAGTFSLHAQRSMVKPIPAAGRPALKRTPWQHLFQRAATVA